MASSPAPNPADELAQLRALEEKFVLGMNGKDLDSVMSVYDPGESLFVFDVVGPPSAHVGWAEYREAFRRMFAGISGSLHLALSNFDVEVFGDIAYGRSLQRVSGVHNDGESFDYSVRVTDVYRKIAGKWLIVQEHLSLPIERETFSPMLH
ncbi:MAG TPA: nuclear transport factor 2 family protein [Candidatus Baltobacteraceae bacterium]|nr:nuclear transport factor 2 family protein [Candidatus Baltobacteraceae bacterium]